MNFSKVSALVYSHYIENFGEFFAADASSGGGYALQEIGLLEEELLHAQAQVWMLIEPIDASPECV